MVFEGAAHGRLDVPQVEGLRHVVERAGAHGPHRGLDVLHAAEHDDGRVGRALAHERDEVEPVHPPHLDVAQDEFEPPAVEKPERLLGRAALGAGIVVAEQAGEDAPDRGRVGEDEDARPLRFGVNPLKAHKWSLHLVG